MAEKADGEVSSPREGEPYSPPTEKKAINNANGNNNLGAEDTHI